MTLNTLTFDLITREGVSTRAVSIDRAIIAGWAGRDHTAMEAHIVELEELGIARPATTPVFYNVSASRLTHRPDIEDTGAGASGEAECLLVISGGELWIGVASDHTDRQVEAYDITVSKQMCDKPVGRVMWPWHEVAPHWDALELHSEILEEGNWVAYQTGSVSALLSPLDLLERLCQVSPVLRAMDLAMLCGTLPTIGGIRPSDCFRFRLVDPVLGREIRAGYRRSSLVA